MIGDQLTTDILFGNINNMQTIWVYRFMNECKKLKEINKDLYDLEKMQRDTVIKEKDIVFDGTYDF